jgi:uncharacterized membrane-anchored protein
MVQFFKDGTGQLSMMRLITFLVIVVILLVWLIVNIISVLKGGSVILDFQPQMVYIIGLVIVGKVGQSITENLAPNKGGP